MRQDSEQADPVHLAGKPELDTVRPPLQTNLRSEFCVLLSPRCVERVLDQAIGKEIENRHKQQPSRQSERGVLESRQEAQRPLAPPARQIRLFLPSPDLAHLDEVSSFDYSSGWAGIEPPQAKMGCRALSFDQSDAEDPVSRIFHGDQGTNLA
jgi:hypothetical protein